MSDIEITLPVATTVSGATTEVITNTPVVPDITLDTTNIAEVSTNTYVLSSGGMYGAGYSGGIPGWLQSAIDQGIFAGIDGQIDIDMLSESLRTLINGAAEGVNQHITRIEDTEKSISALVTTVIANFETNSSGIADLSIAYADADSTYAAKISALESIFGNTAASARAWALSQLSTYTSQTAANASDISLLESTINDTTTGVAVTATAYSELSTRVGFKDGEDQALGLIADVASLQAQIDGVVETHFGDPSPIHVTTKAPLITIEPYKTWYEVDYGINPVDAGKAATPVTTERDLHTGDTYVDYDLSNTDEATCLAGGGTWNGSVCDPIDTKVYKVSYKFAKGAVSDPITDTDNEGYMWLAITDSVAIEALAKATTAQDTADGKRAVFVNNPFYIDILDSNIKKYRQDIEPGDIWLVDNTVDPFYLPVGYKNKEMLRASNEQSKDQLYLDTDWEVANRYTTDIDNISDDLIGALARVDDLDSIQDGEIVIYFNDKALEDIDPAETDDFGAISAAFTATVDNGLITVVSLDAPIDYGSIHAAELKYGDYWLDIASVQDAGGYHKVWFWNDVTWVLSENAIAKGISDTYRAKLYANDIKAIADGKITVWYNDNAPSLSIDDIGDLWVDTNDFNITYVWDGNSWADTNNRVANDAFDIAQAATESLAIESAKIAGLEETNDGVVVTYYTSNYLSVEDIVGMSYGDWLVYDKDVDYPTRVDRYEDINRKNVSTLYWRNSSNDLYAQSLIQAYDSRFVADGKTVVYYSSADPGIANVLDDGDMWVDTTDTKNITKVWDTGSWKDTSNLGAENADAKAQQALNDLGTEALRIDGLEESSDGLVTTYYGTEAEKVAKTGMSYGDWFVIDTTSPIIDTVYRYEGTGGLKVGTLSWVDRTGTSYSNALIQAYNAQYTADGKVQTLYESAVPTTGNNDTALDKGDMFVPTANCSALLDDALFDYKVSTIYIWIEGTGAYSTTFGWRDMYSSGNVKDLLGYADAVYPALARLDDQLDGKIVAKLGTIAEMYAWSALWLTPYIRLLHSADVWFCNDATDGANFEKAFRYDHSVDNWIVDASLDYSATGETAFDDGKFTSYYGSSIERSAESASWGINAQFNNIGDFWYVPHKSDRYSAADETANPDNIEGTFKPAVEIDDSIYDPDTYNGDNGTTLHFHRGYKWSGSNWYEIKDHVAFAVSERVTNLSASVGNLKATSASIEYVDLREIAIDGKIETAIGTGFTYDSTVKIGTSYYSTGFGLTANAQAGEDGTQINPYSSEFSIDANLFSFYDKSTDARIPVFSAAAGEITFNGVVSFTNTDMSGYDNTNIIQPTYTEGIVDPISTTEPIQSVYLNTVTGGLWTYTGVTTGWVPGGDPDALLATDLEDAITNNVTNIDGGKITTGSMSAYRVRTGKIVNTNAYDVNGDYKGDAHADTSMVIDLDSGSIWIK